MADQVQAGRPRVALIFGDAAAVKHLRDAMVEQVDVVYAAQAADFDAAKLAESHARAAVVNLDSFEWLDTIGAQLSKAGVAVVFNDPEISSQLDGWERARWLRHLVAKLRGSDDYDPPRPLPERAATVAETPTQPEPAVPTVAPRVEPAVAARPLPETAAPVAQTPVPPEPDAPTVASRVVPAMAERPLSAHELDTLTVDFVTTPAAAVAVDRGQPEPAVPPAENAAQPDSSDAGADALDVDTAALSAMIDARLAESEQHEPESADAWQGDAAAVAASVDVAASAAPTPDVPEVEIAAAAPAPAAAPPPDDSDVLADLPALDDWELLDPDLPVAPVASVKHAESAAPAISDDLSGLELVPMDNNVPIGLRVEPIEHRMHVEARKQQQAAAEHKAADSNGEHA